MQLKSNLNQLSLSHEMTKLIFQVQGLVHVFTDSYNNDTTDIYMLPDSMSYIQWKILTCNRTREDIPH